MASKPLVTAAVVSWNTRDLLARCLDSLEPEARRGRVEAWVVDNASSDGSSVLVRERYGWVNLLEPEENLGFGRAVNLVASQTRSPFLAIANADVAVRAGALDALLDAAGRDPGAAAFAPRLVLPDGSTQHSVFAFPTLPWTFLFNTGLFHLSRDLADRMALVGLWDSTRARRVPWAVGAFLLVRRDAWEQVDGFDERQWMYAEDLDLGWRLRRAGWAVRYEPRARVDHEHGASTRQAWGGDDRISARWQRNTYGWMALRRGLVQTWAAAAMNFVGCGARYLAMVPMAWLAPDPWADRRRRLGKWTLVHLSGLRGARRLRGYR